MTLLHYLGLPSEARSAYLLGIRQSTPDRILQAVTGYTGIAPANLLSKARHAPIAEARQIAMLLMRKSAGMTLKAIGRKFNRDHATVIYSVRKAEEMLQYDKDFEKMYNGIIEKI